MYKTRITKCYLIEVIDSEGYAVFDDFCFGTRKESEKKAKTMKGAWETLHPQKGEDDGKMSDMW